VKQILAAALIALPALAQAQVGYPPERSPYRDLEFRQELTGYAGYFLASEDRLGVAPKSGPLVGARYDVRVGGPVALTVRAARVFSERRPINPAFPVATRNLSTRSWPLYLSDLGLTLNLTGQKSLRGLVPVLTGGIGVATDFKGEDVGGYEFGTSFAFSFGGGVRWVPGGRFQLRADVADYLYQIRYPDSYTTGATGVPPVLSGGRGQNSWKHNAAVTIGASYLFFR
jgi:hypothetical protein